MLNLEALQKEDKSFAEWVRWWVDLSNEERQEYMNSLENPNSKELWRLFTLQCSKVIAGKEKNQKTFNK